MVADLDYVRHGTYFKRFERPPRLPTDEEIKIFGEELAKEIPEKLKQLVERAEELESDKKRCMGIITAKVESGELDWLGEYFWTFYVTCNYAEIFIIKKWTKYWLKLATMADAQVKQWVQVQDDGLSEDMLEKAREFPIEQLYKGDLISHGTRLTGLCPFHGEKTGSFMIYTDNNTYYCFGCHDGGDSIDFYRKINEVSFAEAVRALQ